MDSQSLSGFPLPIDAGVSTPEAVWPSIGKPRNPNRPDEPARVQESPPLLASALARRRGFPWNLLLAVIATPFVLLVVFVAAMILSFRMGGEARALRHEVFAASPGEWEREVEFGVGALPSLLARTGLRFVNLDLPPEARVGINAFRSADIGVYHRRVAATTRSKREALTRVDALMARRGWEPLVSVQDGDEAVRVFLPEDFSSLHRMRACVFVMDGDQMVIVSARVDAEPLADLAEKLLSEKVDLVAALN